MIPVKDRLLHTHTASSVSALISCLPHFVCQGHCTIYWGPESISTTLWACTDEWFTPSKYLYQINSSNSQKRNTTSMRRLWMDDLKNDVKKDGMRRLWADRICFLQHSPKRKPTATHNTTCDGEV